MLRKETVNKPTLELLSRLFKDQKLTQFTLVGGTALALIIGHRISVDIDLFSEISFNQDEILEYLETKYQFVLDYISTNTLKGEIDNIKVDLISHRYPKVKSDLIIENIRLASLEDIAAMKLNAIIVNGSRVKDFIDIPFLSNYLSFHQMMEAFEHKCQTRNPVMVLKSILHFRDLNLDEPIKLMDRNFDWELIENRLKYMVEKPDLIFETI